MKSDEKQTISSEETVTISRAEYDAQQEQIAELKSQNGWLMEQLRLARQKRFGASSEQSSEDALEYLGCLFNEVEVYADQEAKESTEAEESVAVAAHKRHKKHEYTLDKMRENIPVEVVEHRLTEEERACSQCGK